MISVTERYMQIDGDPNHVVFYLNPSGGKGAGIYSTNTLKTF
jgi:hypothetical protein